MLLKPSQGHVAGAVLLAAALYFTVRGSPAFGLDNWIGEWVVHLF